MGEHSLALRTHLQPSHVGAKRRPVKATNRSMWGNVEVEVRKGFPEEGAPKPWKKGRCVTGEAWVCEER